MAIAHKLQQAGVSATSTSFRDLVAVARKDVVLSEGWGEPQFRRIAALAGGDVEFRTLPVVRYATVDGQDVNIVDPAAIRAEIAADIAGTDATSPADAPAATQPQSAIVVVNASDIYGLASRTADLLTRRGYTVEDPRPQRRRVSRHQYRIRSWGCRRRRVAGRCARNRRRAPARPHRGSGTNPGDTRAGIPNP